MLLPLLLRIFFFQLGFSQVPNALSNFLEHWPVDAMVYHPESRYSFLQLLECWLRMGTALFEGSSFVLFANFLRSLLGSARSNNWSIWTYKGKASASTQEQSAGSSQFRRPWDLLRLQQHLCCSSVSPSAQSCFSQSLTNIAPEDTTQ